MLKKISYPSSYTSYYNHYCKYYPKHVLSFFIITKYNIIFPGIQTSLVLSTCSSCHFLYILIYLIDREAWPVRGGGVTYPFFPYTPSPYSWSHILISLYHYIFISVFYDPLDLLFVTLVTLSPLIFHTGSSYLFFLIYIHLFSLRLYTCSPYPFSLLDSPTI